MQPASLAEAVPEQKLTTTSSLFLKTKETVM